MTTNAQSGGLLSAGAVRRRLGGVTSMTIWRWQRAGILPAPTKIGKRNYWPVSVIDAIAAGGEPSKVAA